MKEVPEDLLTGLKNLHELDISNNQLDKLPLGLRGLTKLSLAGNVGISQLLPDDFSALPGLQEVDLSSLSLRALPRGLFRSSPRLRAVSLAQNPFNCVCPLGWLAEWLRVSGVTLLRPDETRCHFPPKNAGKTLRQLRDSEYGCPPPTTIAVPSTTGPGSTTEAPRLTEPLDKEETTTAPAFFHHQAEEDLTSPAQFSIEDQLCPPDICLNGGSCHLDPTGQLECACPLGFSGLYCETSPIVPVPAAVTERPPARLHVLEVTGSSLRVDLQSYSQSKDQLRGIRLTLHNLSGSDRRPVILNLPPTLSEYTVRGLAPNCTYWLCLGSQSEEELCTEAQTAGESRQASAHVTQSRDGGLTLVLVPAVAAGILLSVVAASAACYARRRRGKGQAGVDGGPLEMDGVKTGLDGMGELRKLSEGPAGPERGGGESQEPLMEPVRVGNNNDASMGRLPHSYF
ncbi:hypothetical protein FKM82_027344 [Ascaphus truei]